MKWFLNETKWSREERERKKESSITCWTHEGEIQWIEEQNNIFALVIFQRDFSKISIDNRRCSKIRSWFADLCWHSGWRCLENFCRIIWNEREARWNGERQRMSLLMIKINVQLVISVKESLICGKLFHVSRSVKESSVLSHKSLSMLIYAKREIFQEVISVSWLCSRIIPPVWMEEKIKAQSSRSDHLI